MKNASKLAFAMLAATVASFSLCAEDSIDITDVWRVSAVKATANADKTKPLPEGSEWKPGKLSGKIPLANGAKDGNSFEGDYNAWYRKNVDIPADWKGSSVRYEQQLNWCSAVVFVNGKRAGVAHFPDGAVELAPFLKFGGSNEIKIFATNRGYGTGENGVVYRGRGDWGRGFGADHFWRKASLLRLRDAAPVDVLHPTAGWKVDGKGAIAVSNDGRIVFDQIPLYLIADRARAAKDSVCHRNWSQSQDNQLRRHALLLGKWGAMPSEVTLARALHLAAEKEESKANLYWSENLGFDPFLFVYW